MSIGQAEIMEMFAGGWGTGNGERGTARPPAWAVLLWAAAINAALLVPVMAKWAAAVGWWFGE